MPEGREGEKTIILYIIVPIVALMAQKVSIEKIGEWNLILPPLYKRADNDGRVFLSRELKNQEVLILVAQPTKDDKARFVPVGRPRYDPLMFEKKVISDCLLLDLNRDENLFAYLSNLGLTPVTEDDYILYHDALDDLNETIWNSDDLEYSDDYFEEIRKDLYEVLLDEENEEDKRGRAIIDQAVNNLQAYLKGSEEENEEES